MNRDWILRAGDGDNLKQSSRYKIWGINSSGSNAKDFLKNVKLGDRLWFVKNKSHGKLIAVATYTSHNKREITGNLITLTRSDEELGWLQNEKTSKVKNLDTEVHYNHLYGLNDCELFTYIEGPPPIRKYNNKCKLNLPEEYKNIVKYSKVSLEL